MSFGNSTQNGPRSLLTITSTPQRWAFLQVSEVSRQIRQSSATCPLLAGALWGSARMYKGLKKYSYVTTKQCGMV